MNMTYSYMLMTLACGMIFTMPVTGITSDKFTRRKGYLNNSDVMDSITVTSRLVCADLCGRQPRCSAANLRKIGNASGYDCELFPSYNRNDTVVADGSDVIIKIPKAFCELSNPCQNGGVCEDLDPPPNYTCVCPVHCSGTHCETCCTIDGLHGDITSLTVVNGVTTVTKDVFVESGPAGDGWIVLMRRKDGTVNFVTKMWNDFKNGFGSNLGEFWIGNDFMHHLTNNGSSYRLRVDLRSYAGQCRYAEYSVFSIADEADDYRLTIDGYSGTAGDSFTSEVGTYKDHRNARFSTSDKDNDGYSGSCTDTYKGAWWYTRCFHSKLTGQWGQVTGGHGVEWEAWLGEEQPVQYADMKIHVQ